MQPALNPAAVLPVFRSILLLLCIATAAFAQYTPQYFTSVEQRDRWIADVREAIRKQERQLAETERTAARWLANANRNTNPSMREADLADYKRWSKLAEDDRHRLEALKQKLENIPPVRDLEAERREQQRLADERAAAQRRVQEQQMARTRQSEAAAAKQSQRQERANGIANALTEGFNRANEQNRKYEEFQEARRERERQWEREEREIDRLRQQEAAQKAAQAAARSALPAPVIQPAYIPPPVAPTPVASVPVPEPEPYSPPSLRGFLSDDAKKFGADVVVETVTILAEQFSDGASNLRGAARGGIRGLTERTYDAIVDDLLDSGKDAVKDSAMNLLSEDRQLLVRAVDVPVSILTRNWDTIKDAWNSLVDNHLKNPLDAFTVESIVNEGTGTWPSGAP